MTNEIPTEALEAAAVAAYASDLNDSVDHGWKWPMPSWSQLPPDARDSLRDKVRPVLAAAAPYLIAEGRRQAAAEIALDLRQSATIMDPAAADQYRRLADHLDNLEAVDETPALMDRYERELRAKIAAEIRAGADQFRKDRHDVHPVAQALSPGAAMAALSTVEWAARIAEGTEHG